MSGTSNLFDLWAEITRAGGPRAFVDARLRERGFLVERRDVDGMSERDKERYKKELRAEAAERRKLAREAWNAFKAHNIAHLGDGVPWTDAKGPDRWDRRDAEERAAENELPPLDEPAALAEALGLTVPGLRSLAYHRDAAKSIHYRRFAIPKKGGGERAIWAPTPRLKRAQHWILRNIAEKLPVHGAAHGFLAGRSIRSNAEVHMNSKIILKLDIKDFFPTVTLRRARGIFRQAGYRDRIATLLALICTEAPREIVERDGTTYYVALGPRCLPQGAPTSPALTNTLCLNLDRRLSGLARSMGWRYTRYADDLTFSLPNSHAGPPRLGKLLGAARATVESEGFRLNPEKTRVSRRGGRQKVTGLVVNAPGAPRLSRETRRRIRAMLHNLERGKGLHPGETVAGLEGWIAFAAMTDPDLARGWRDRLNAIREAGGPAESPEST